MRSHPRLSTPRSQQRRFQPLKLQRTLPFGLVALSAALPVMAQPSSSAPIAPQTLPLRRGVLPSGLHVVTRIDRTSPRVAFSLVVKASANDETFATAGWRRVLAESMLNASRSIGGVRTQEERDRLAEAIGGRIGASINDDGIEFWATGNSQYAPQLLELLMNVVTRPRIADNDVDLARERVRGRRGLVANDVASLASEALDVNLYRDITNRPVAYGLPDVGTAASLRTLNAATLRELHTRFFRPANAVLAATGDLNESPLRAEIAEQSVDWATLIGAKFTPTPAPAYAAVIPVQPIEVTSPAGVSNQWVFVGFRVAEATSADWPALQVMAAALGASPTGRLPLRLQAAPGSEAFSASLRNSQPLQAGAADVASALLQPRRYSSEFIVFAQGANRAVGAPQLRDALFEEVRKLREQPISATELENAKRYVIGQRALEREGLRQRAFQFALEESYLPVPTGGFTPVATATEAASGSGTYVNVADDWEERIENVTVENVQLMARRYLNYGATVFVRPAQAATPRS